MPRPSGTHHADPLRLRRGLTGRALVVASLLVALAAGTGCSAAKPARKKGKSKAAAAREREERPLLEATDAGAAKAETADDGGGVPAPDGAAATTEPATATDPVGPTDDATSPSAEPAPPAAPPQPITTDDASASLPPLEAPAPGGPRPRSPLVDPDTAIPLDGGRVEVSSPVGWTRSPRSQQWLVRYQPGPRKSFPSIVVTAEPAPDGLERVTRKNQADLVAAITAKLAVDFPAGGDVKVIRKPAAVTLGEHAGVAWAVPGSTKIDGLTETVDRFAWGVVLGGRLYIVEARAPRGKVDDAAKDRAKAVASTLVRPQGAPAGDPAPAATSAE